MRNWKIILWLVLFFPVGLYLMFMYSNWKKPVQYGIAGFISLLLIIGSIEVRSGLLFVGSFAAIIIGILGLIRKKSRRNGLAVLVIGVLVFAVSFPVVSEYFEEIERQEQLAIAEAERVAEEKRLEEVARKEEEKRLEEEKKLKDKIVLAIEKVENYPTPNNYNAALKLLGGLEKEDLELTNRLKDS